VISLSLESLPNARRVPNRTEIGIVRMRKDGEMKKRRLKILKGLTPLLRINSIRLKILSIRRILSLPSIFLKIHCLGFTCRRASSRSLKRSPGATNFSIASIFAGGALYLGIVGLLLGIAGGLLVCLAIENIHHFIEIPKDIYYFDRVPVSINSSDLFWISICAIAICFFIRHISGLESSKAKTCRSLKIRVKKGKYYFLKGFQVRMKKVRLF
jgi:hypothetical protein